VKKLFHDPTMCIQEKAGLESADSYAATIRELFGLKKNN
jgi:glutamyl-tRNA reductase